MEPERVIVSRSGERPITRWRREQQQQQQQEPSERSQAYNERPTTAVSRSYSKMERPTSRRGIKTDITEYGISRPPTSGRNVLSRPPSAGSSSNSSRMPTAAPRINTMSSANLSRMNSGLPRNFPQPNIMVIDRPITQHGLAGVRPGSSRGIPRSARPMQDKKYYEQVLKLKIRDLNQEIGTITREIERRNKEKATYVQYDQRSKELANELADLQNKLAEYNVVLDKITTGVDRKEMEREARELKEQNDREEAEIERVFQRRQDAEKKMIELNKEIESKRKVTDKLTDNGDSEPRYKFDEAHKEKFELQREIDNLKLQYDQLSDQKSRLEEKIAQSPMKQEAYKLYIKIFEAEQKRDSLLEEKNSSLPSEEEKELLLKKIRQDNFDVAAAEKQLMDLERKIADAEQELEQLETDIDKSQSEKQSRYNEPKSQEEINDNFTSSFEKNKTEELEKLSRLEEQILERLEQISNNIDGNVDSSILVADEVEMLRGLMDQNTENSGEKSFEELKQDNLRLRQISSKLEALEAKIRNETNDGPARTVEDSNFYEEIDKEKRRELFARSKELLEQQRRADEEIEAVKRDYSKLKEQIEEDEIYRSISILEDKLERASYENEQLEQSIKEQRKEVSYSNLMEKVLSLAAQYNTILINDMKTVY